MKILVATVAVLVFAAETACGQSAWTEFRVRGVFHGGNMNFVEAYTSTGGVRPGGRDATINTTVVLQPDTYFLYAEAVALSSTDPSSFDGSRPKGGWAALGFDIDFGAVPTLSNATSTPYSVAHWQQPQSVGWTTVNGPQGRIMPPLPVDEGWDLAPGSNFVLSAGRWVVTLQGSQLHFDCNVQADSQAREEQGTEYHAAAVSSASLEVTFVVTTPVTFTVTGACRSILRGEDSRWPIPPDYDASCPNPPCFRIPQAPPSAWVDPPLAAGFRFAADAPALITEIEELPSGIDGDGLFEIVVDGNSLGTFAEGTGVDFVTLLGAGVSAFEVFGIDPSPDATDGLAFPVKLDYSTPTADLTITPLTVRPIGTSCLDPAFCASCSTMAMSTTGPALINDSTFGFQFDNAPAGGAGAVLLSFRRCSSFPFFCGSLEPTFSPIFLGGTSFTGTGMCDGTGFVPLPLPNNPAIFGWTLCSQAAVLCAGGSGLVQPEQGNRGIPARS